MPPTNYPGAIDSFTDPTSGQFQNNPSHSGQHANINDAMVAVQTALGTSSAPKFATLASPIFTGAPKAPTQTALSANTDIATTAYADSAVAIETARATAAELLKAPLASPTFTGVPRGVTNATATDSTAQLATDAFVQNAIAAATGVSLPWFNAASSVYATAGPIGQGNSTYDTTAMTNCATAMKNAGGGIMVWPAGTFKITTWPTFQTTGSNTFPYAIKGQGRGVTIFNSYASSLATSLTFESSGFSQTSAPFPSETGGFTIDGTNATSTAVGISFGDISYLTFGDMGIQNFASTGAFYVLNAVQWTEGTTMRSVAVNNCGYAIDYNVGASGFTSFDYWNVDELYVNANANQSIIVDEVSLGSTPVQHLGCHYRIVANCQTGTTNTGAFMWLKGNSTYDYCDWDVHCEVDGGAATNHTSFKFAAGAISHGFGTLYFFGSFQSPSLSGGGYQIEITGNVYIPGLYTVAGGLTTAGSGGNAQYIYNGFTAPTITSGTPWVNNQGGDVTLYIPVTLSASATLKFVQQNYTISAAGATLLAAPSGGTAFVFTVKVHVNEQIRLDVSAGSIGTVQACWG